MSTLYALKKHKETDELHLFENYRNVDEKCMTKGNDSLCNQVERKDFLNSSLFSCEDEQQAREKCAKIGRDVCGNCIKTLYTT